IATRSASRGYRCSQWRRSVILTVSVGCRSNGTFILGLLARARFYGAAVTRGGRSPSTGERCCTSSVVFARTSADAPWAASRGSHPAHDKLFGRRRTALRLRGLPLPSFSSFRHTITHVLAAPLHRRLAVGLVAALGVFALADGVVRSQESASLEIGT